MVVKRRKKNTTQRGSRTCGWGLVHRGAGQRGGSGKGGIKAKQPQRGAWKLQVLGKHGFVYQGHKKADIAINLRDLEQRSANLLAEKQAKQEAGVITVDLTKLGYTKLLGTGKAMHKWKINVKKAVPNAVDKIKAAGGEVVIAQ